MNKKFFLFFCSLCVGLVLGAQTNIKMMSFNIRLDVASDGENRWELRKDKVAGLINYYEPDFVGGQEVQHQQLQYLLQNSSAVAIPVAKFKRLSTNWRGKR